jgi:hypothetical protein
MSRLLSRLSACSKIQNLERINSPLSPIQNQGLFHFFQSEHVTMRRCATIKALPVELLPFHRNDILMQNNVQIQRMQYET